MKDAEQPIKTGTYKVSNGQYNRIYYVRESALQSILADIFTFGTLMGLTTLNYLYWGGHWYFNIVIIFCWISFTLGKARAKLQEFNSRSELVDHLIKELESEGETSK